MTTIKRLAEYRKALEQFLKELAEWTRRNGPFGGGGAWDKKGQYYLRAPMPVEPQFGDADPFTLKLAAKIRAEVLK